MIYTASSGTLTVKRVSSAIASVHVTLSELLAPFADGAEEFTFGDEEETCWNCFGMKMHKTW